MSSSQGEGGSRRRRGRSLNLASAVARAADAGRRSAEADLRVEAENLRREGAARLLPISMVKPRAALDTRPVDPDHVSALMESIRAVGLIQPIYLDREMRLVAGAHRLAAFRALAAEDAQGDAQSDSGGRSEGNSKRWAKIPVVVDPDLDAAEQPELALQREIVENEKRSNLTPAQVKAAAERLLASDSGFTRRPGRLKRGERALTPFLANTFGVSTRYVRSLLNQESAPKRDEIGGGERAETDGAEVRSEVSSAKLRSRMLKQVNRWLKEPALADDPELTERVDQLRRHLQELAQ